MPKHQPFIIPAGVRFEIGATGINIEHVGDVVLHDSLGKDINRIVSQEGSIVLHGKFTCHELKATEGTIQLDGSVEADHVHGKIVEISGAKMRARSIRGGQQIVVGPVKIVADIMIAPRIDVDPGASGRIPVIESHNSPGPNAIKGGFSLKEYDELLGDSSTFLKEHGLEPLESAPSASEEEEEEDEEENSNAIIETPSADDGVNPSADEEGTDDPDTDPGDAGMILERLTPMGVDPFLLAEAAISRLGNSSDIEEVVTLPETAKTGPIRIRMPDPDKPEPIRVRVSVPPDDPKLDTFPTWDESDAEPEIAPVEIHRHEPATVRARPEVEAAVEDRVPAIAVSPAPPEQPLPVLREEPELVESEPLPAPVVEAEPRYEPGTSISPDDMAPVQGDTFAEISFREEKLAEPDDATELKPDDPIYNLLKTSLDELVACYEDVEIPPPLQELVKLIEDRAYDKVKVRLSPIWQNLVKYHRENGLRIRKQVTTAFNTIMNIVKNAAIPT